MYKIIIMSVASQLIPSAIITAGTNESIGQRYGTNSIIPPMRAREKILPVLILNTNSTISSPIYVRQKIEKLRMRDALIHETQTSWIFAKRYLICFSSCSGMSSKNTLPSVLRSKIIKNVAILINKILVKVFQMELTMEIPPLVIDDT